VDWRKEEFNLGIQVDVSAGATLTWAVEMTMDDIYDTSITPVATVAPAPLDTGTGDEVGQITIPCRAIRLNLTWTSGSAKMTVVQAG
jgi:hypothetical protein